MSRNPVFALEMIQTLGAIEKSKNNKEQGRNPVFALEMIQTEKSSPDGISGSRLSQSSIRPGDDSDSCGSALQI